MAYRTLIFLAKAWTVMAMVIIVYSALHFPQTAEGTDYVMTFYAAGHLVASGEASRLYPEPGARSFTESAFNRATHALLPHLPRQVTAAYMYSPLVAWQFAPLSHLAPNLSLLLWQGISLAALAVCCALLGRRTGMAATDIFCSSFLLFPVFITIWIGQAGLVFGLLPLCAGYFLITADRSFLAGLAWSFLSLKPQYLPAVGLVGLALTLVGRIHCLAGLAVGSSALFAANLVIFPREVTTNWLMSFAVSDAMFSSGLYKVPVHLITSLPSNLLMVAPPAYRGLVKCTVYFLSGSVWIAALWQSRRLLERHGRNAAAISLSLVFGVVLLPVVAPHLLYYDLALLLPVGAILFAGTWPVDERHRLVRLTWAMWLAIGLYFPIFLIMTPRIELPLALDLLLLGLFGMLLMVTSRLSLRPELSTTPVT